MEEEMIEIEKEFDDDVPLDAREWAAKLDADKLRNQPTFQARKLRRAIAGKLGRYEASKKHMYLSAIESYLDNPDNAKFKERIIENDTTHNVLHFDDGSKWFIEQNYTEAEDKTAFINTSKGFLKDLTDEHWGISAESDLARPQDGYRGKELDAEEFDATDKFNDGQNYEKFETDWDKDAPRPELIKLYKQLSNGRTVNKFENEKRKKLGLKPLPDFDAELNHINMVIFDNIEKRHKERQACRERFAKEHNMTLEQVYAKENAIEEAKPYVKPPLLNRVSYVMPDELIYHSSKNVPIDIAVINAYLAKRKYKQTKPDKLALDTTSADSSKIELINK